MPATAIRRLLITAALATALCAALAQPAMAETARTVGTIRLAPQAVTLANPAKRGETAPKKTFHVALTLLDTERTPITSGPITPVRIRIYGPSPAVLTAPTVIDSATPKITFRYNGRFVANSIFVTAVSGSAFEQMAFQPKHHGFPGTQSVPFRMKASNVKFGWSFNMAIAGGTPRTVLMDTGSHGIVVSRSALGPGAVGPGSPGRIEYSSDGKVFTGNHYLAPVTLNVGGTIVGGKIVGGKTVATVPIKVLAVDAASCDPKFKDCTPGNPDTVSMLGIGFDRGRTTNAPSPPAVAAAAASSGTPPELGNAFLALTNIVQGSMHPGYLITRNGVTLGISAKNTAGFKKHEISLTPGGTGPGDWNGAPGCFSFPELPAYKPQCGSMLMDTGIPKAILQLPTSQRPRTPLNCTPIKPEKCTPWATIPLNTQVQITVGPARRPGFSYGFTTGGSSSVTPTSIRWATGGPPFVNTGRHVISKYDYMFDAGSGKLGFRRNR